MPRKKNTTSNNISNTLSSSEEEDQSEEEQQTDEYSEQSEVDNTEQVTSTEVTASQRPPPAPSKPKTNLQKANEKATEDKPITIPSSSSNGQNSLSKLHSKITGSNVAAVPSNKSENGRHSSKLSGRMIINGVVPQVPQKTSATVVSQQGEPTSRIPTKLRRRYNNVVDHHEQVITIGVKGSKEEVLAQLLSMGGANNKKGSGMPMFSCPIEENHLTQQNSDMLNIFVGTGHLNRHFKSGIIVQTISLESGYHTLPFTIEFEHVVPHLNRHIVYGSGTTAGKPISFLLREKEVVTKPRCLYDISNELERNFIRDWAFKSRDYENMVFYPQTFSEDLIKTQLSIPRTVNISVKLPPVPSQNQPGKPLLVQEPMWVIVPRLLWTIPGEENPLYSMLVFNTESTEDKLTSMKQIDVYGVYVLDIELKPWVNRLKRSMALINTVDSLDNVLNWKLTKSYSKTEGMKAALESLPKEIYEISLTFRVKIVLPDKRSMARLCPDKQNTPEAMKPSGNTSVEARKNALLN